MTPKGSDPCLPLRELQDFVDGQLVILEGEDAIKENERARSSRIISGMETAYLAGKMAMLKIVSDFIEDKKTTS